MLPAGAAAYPVERIEPFLRLYDHFAAGLTAIDPQLRFGGPGVSGDDRFLRAFNGAGMAGMGLDGFGHPMTEYANFRYNGSILSNILFGSSPSYTPSYNPSYGDPNQISGMDED